MIHSFFLTNQGKNNIIRLTNGLETYITRFVNGENPVISGFAAKIE